MPKAGWYNVHFVFGSWPMDGSVRFIFWAEQDGAIGAQEKEKQHG
jgi:hypothetical protein